MMLAIAFEPMILTYSQFLQAVGGSAPVNFYIGGKVIGAQPDRPEALGMVAGGRFDGYAPDRLLSGRDILPLNAVNDESNEHCLLYQAGPRYHSGKD